jgi:leucyl aminopeptidase
METLLDIIQIIVPAALVFFTAYFLLRNFLKAEEDKRKRAYRNGNQKIVTPLKLQAFERLTLLLERISLQSLVLRTQRAGMSSRNLQMELIKTIRSEFDHNLVQQIYISNKTWEAIKTAKEETTKAINIAATRVSENSDSMELVNMIFEIVSRLEKTPTDVALQILKEEARYVIN